MQLSNRQILKIWNAVLEKEENLTRCVTLAAREIIKVFITYSPTIGFLLYKDENSTPTFEAKYDKDKMRACKYFVPVMAKPKSEDLIPPVRAREQQRLGASLGELILEKIKETEASKQANQTN